MARGFLCYPCFVLDPVDEGGRRFVVRAYRPEVEGFIDCLDRAYSEMLPSEASPSLEVGPFARNLDGKILFEVRNNFGIELGNEEKV